MSLDAVQHNFTDAKDPKQARVEHVARDGSCCWSAQQATWMAASALPGWAPLRWAPAARQPFCAPSTYRQ